MPLYRFLISLFAIGALVGAWRRGGLDLMRARLGFGPRVQGPHIWWHGASNGELTSSRFLLEKVLQARPDLRVLVTCNSATGEALVQGWGLPRVTVRPAPLDLAWILRGFLRRWQVVAHVTLESELWPHRLLQCPGPVIVLGARMTAKNARVWQRFAKLTQRLMASLTLVVPQDQGSADRLAALGLPASVCGPVVDLKAGFAASPPDTPPELAHAFLRHKTWLAASTHPGDEDIVLAAHLIARKTEPDLRLIIAPRHPRRGDDIAKQARASGLSIAQRSATEPPDCDIYLADTMSEMPLWYGLSGRVFIGGTLGSLGGHTPFEPAAFGCAILHGPDVAKQAAGFARLAAAGASIEVAAAEDLAKALLSLSADHAAAGQRAKDALASKNPADEVGALLLKILPNTYGA